MVNFSKHFLTCDNRVLNTQIIPTKFRIRIYNNKLIEFSSDLVSKLK